MGINESERVKKQDILINLTIYTDINQAAKTDDITDALNYRTLTKEIIEYVEQSSNYLIETLADAVAKIAILDNGAERVVVRVEKPHALRFASTVGVEIDRSRIDYE